mgnify:FL=1
MNTVLSTLLCEGLAAWFTSNTYFVQLINPLNKLFKRVDYYYRIDFPQGEMTSISIYPIESDTVKNPSKEIGQIGIDIVFSSGLERETRGKTIYHTLSTIRAQLLNNPNYIQQFLSANYVPGLQFINSQFINSLSASF